MGKPRYHPFLTPKPPKIYKILFSSKCNMLHFIRKDFERRSIISKFYDCYDISRPTMTSYLSGDKIKEFRISSKHNMLYFIRKVFWSVSIFLRFCYVYFIFKSFMTSQLRTLLNVRTSFNSCYCKTSWPPQRCLLRPFNFF